MKRVFLVLFLVAGFSLANLAHAEATVKEVCHDKVGKDGKAVKGKDGKTQQECKKIKVHKKLEGTAVPEKAPAKSAKKDEKKK